MPGPQYGGRKGGRHRGHAAVVLTVCVLPLAACGDEGISEQELRDAKRDAFQDGREDGYDDGLAAGRREARGRVLDARVAGFDRGVEHVFGRMDVEPGQQYAVSFKDSGRGFFVNEWLRMRPGETYECPAFENYCNVESTDAGADIDAVAPGTGAGSCEPSYPDTCLDPTVLDYDCADGDGDGPEFVDGPITVRPPDPFDLDGYPANGVGCE